MSMKVKAYTNALICEKLIKLDKDERRKIVCELLKTSTEQKLADEIGVPRSTLHAWKQSNIPRTQLYNVTLGIIYTRLKNLTPNRIQDWGRLEMIKERCDELLKSRGD